MAQMTDRSERLAIRKERREAKKSRLDASLDNQADDRFRAEMPPDDIKAAEDMARESCLDSHSDHAADKILKKLNPKPPAKGRQNPKRAALDKATLVGGFKRRGRKRRGGKKCEALDGPASRGLRFPDKPETPEQHRELKKIAVGYVQRLMVKQFGGFTDETLAKALGVSDRQVRNIRSQVKKPGRHHEDLELTLEILQGMQSGRIAGVLGTPHTEESRELFSIIHATGRRNVEMDPEHVRSFDMLKSVFEIDYRPWKEEVHPWPFRKDGSDRKKSSGNGTRRTA
jgi:hypothetical protein